MNTQTLEQMKNVDIRSVDPTTLVDIRDVRVNSELTKQERIADFIQQVKNPYCFRVGKIAVKVSFADSGATLEDRLQSLLMKI